MRKQDVSRFPLFPLLAVSIGSLASAQFGPQQPLGGNLLRDLASHDVDGDGDLDLLGVQTGSQARVVLVENLGFGNFGTPGSLTGTLSQPRLELVDMDLDGLLDLLVAETSTTSWMRSLGGTAFGPKQPIGSYTSPRSVTASDFDADGDIDVALAGVTGSRIGWFQNQGGQAFGPFTSISNGVTTPERLRTADLDDDGLPDLYVASSNDDRIGWIRNLGAGAFGVFRLVTSAADGPLDVLAADVNGDNLLDLVAASSNDNEVAYYPNTGGGSFGPQQLLDVTATGAGAVDVADVDLDGDPDIVSASQASVRWYENVGLGFFGTPQILMGTPATTSLSVLAFDGDGDSDTDVFSNLPDVYLNQTTLGTIYCSSTINSSGSDARLAVTGSTRANLNALTLTATQLPPNEFGYFLNSLTPGMSTPPGSQGILCLSGGIGRYSAQILFSGVLGRIQLTGDLTQTPIPTGFVAVAAGQTWHFQAWFRDTVTPPTSNFSDAARVVFN